MTFRQLRGFGGITGYRCFWILGYGELAQPLYKLITEPQQAQNQQVGLVSRYSKAFMSLQTSLLQALTLSLPTGSEFNVFVIERKGMALGDSIQP